MENIKTKKFMNF